jgi:hypothetical protein
MSGRYVCALAVTLAVIAGGVGCGGGGASVAWKDKPRAGAVEGGQMLFGTVVNRSAKPLRLRAGDVHVLDRGGHALPSAAAFSGGYLAGVALRGFGSEMFASATGGASTGTSAVLAPRATVPLSVSWKGSAAAVEVAGTRLPVH